RAGGRHRPAPIARRGHGPAGAVLRARAHCPGQPAGRCGSRRRRRHEMMARVREYLPAAVVFVTGLAAWEAIVGAFGIEFYLLPAPHVIALNLCETYAVLLEAGLYTFTEAVVGYTLGCGGA